MVTERKRKELASKIKKLENDIATLVKENGLLKLQLYALEAKVTNDKIEEKSALLDLYSVSVKDETVGGPPKTKKLMKGRL